MILALAPVCCPTAAGYLTGSFLDWFTNHGQYQTLSHCMGHDWPWITATIVLDVAVAAGYLLIARHWWVNQRTLPDSPARQALGNLRNIFLFCGICGYVFIPIKMVWPAWRLYDLFMLALVFYTWRYALTAKGLKVIYAELGRGSQLQRELEQTREESGRKSFFLNAISHDLRTPLNGLMLHSSLAEMNAETGDRDGLNQSLRDIRASAKATADLLDSLLEYARMDWATDANVVATFGLGDAVRAAADQFQAAADQKGLELRVRCPADLTVATDRVKLDRVLANLLSNAVKFTHQGWVRVDVVSAGPAVEVHVVDSGVGIAPESHERLFEEFFQVANHERDRRKGFGLGLAIARRLALQLGGDIMVDSAVGKGSRFTLALPTAVVVGDGSVRPAVAPARVDRPEPVAVTTG